MKHKRIAVIGNGRWGANIIRTLRSIPGCEVAYVATRDYKRLLKRDDIDGVAIATTASTHAKIASVFLKKGLPVFIEKPFTTNLPDAKKLVALSRKHRANIFVGHIHLYNPTYLAMKKRLTSIGKIRFILCESGGPGPIRKDASTLWDWTPHDAAIVLDLTGKKPKRVEAPGNDDAVSVRLEFANGLSAQMFNSRTLPKKCRRVTVVGTKGTLVFDDFAKKKKNVDAPLTVELRAWIQSIGTNKKFPTDAAEGLAVTEMLSAAARSLAAGRS